MKCRPWRWLWGLPLVLALTYLAATLEQDRIHADLSTRTQVALQAAGLSWAKTQFSGLDGAISGRAIDDEELRRASTIATRVWGVRVVDNRAGLIDKAEAYVWGAALRGNRIKLTGYVPNLKLRQAIVGTAKANFPNRQIDDNMKLARGVPSRDVWLGGVSFALRQLGFLDTGAAQLNGTQLSVLGQARDGGAYRAVQTALRNGLPTGVTLAKAEVKPAVARPFRWRADYDGRQLVLKGHVPSESAREALTAMAKKAYPNVAVVDRLETASGDPPGWLSAVNVALRELARTTKGWARFTDAQLKFVGEAQKEKTSKSIAANLASGLPNGFRLKTELTFVEAEIKPVSPFTTSMSINAGTVYLNGFVPSQERRQALVDAVKARFKTSAVVDRMQIAAGAPRDWRLCTGIGVTALGKLKGGRFELSDRRLTVTGSTRDEAIANALAGEVRASAGRSCDADVRVDFVAPPEPNLIWRVDRTGEGEVLMSGEVPSLATKTMLVRRAGKLFPKARVIDRMTVKPGYPKKWRQVAATGLDLLGRLRTGKVRLEGQVLQLSGEAADTTIVTAIRGRLAQDLPRGYAGQNDIAIKSDAMIWAEQEAKRKALAKAEAERKAREEAERKRREERERRRLEREREAREARERAAREAQARARAERERQRLEAERQAREARDAAAREEAQRRAREAAARQAREEEARRIAEREAAERARAEAARVAALAAARAEAERKAKAEEAAAEAARQAARQVAAARQAAAARERAEAARKAEEARARVRAALERRRAEAERAAKERAAALAKLSAEEAARRRAEEAAAEARRQAELARQRAEEEERRRAEAIAAARAAQEARRRAEQQARERAEEERRKAAEEARLAAARQEAEQAKAARVARQREEAARQAALNARETKRQKCESAMQSVARTGTILFRRGFATLRRGSRPTLDQIARAANTCPNLSVTIEGHTDADGPTARNQRLSERRASTVVRYLVRQGVARDRLSAVGFGEARPIVPNTSPRNKQRNRRIEFRVTTK